MKKDTRAVAILITLTVLGAVIAVGLGIAVIVARELSITTFVDDAAVMAADAGLERRLYEIRRLGWQQNQYDDQYGPVQLSNGASYEICPQGAQCRGNNPVRIVTEGSFNQTTRSLQVEF